MNRPQLTDPELSLVCGVLGRQASVCTAILFGSRAKGTHAPQSDGPKKVSGTFSPPEEADRQKEGPRAVAATPLQHPGGIAGDHPVGVMRVALGGGVPAERAAELARLEREDLRLLLEPVAAGRIEFEFPGGGVVVAGEAGEGKR
jgi:hypothetical protein